MPRHAQFDRGKQIPLALDLMGSARTGPALFAAYRRLELSRRLSFEQVMSDRAYAIGVRNLADAIARRGTAGRATGGTPAVGGPAASADTLSSSRTEFSHSGTEKGDH